MPLSCVYARVRACGQYTRNWAEMPTQNRPRCYCGDGMDHVRLQHYGPYRPARDLLASHRCPRMRFASSAAVLWRGPEAAKLFAFPEFRDRASFPEARGVRHLACMVDEVEKARDDLLGKGVEKVEEVRLDELTEKKFLFFYDPNGQPWDCMKNNLPKM